MYLSPEKFDYFISRLSESNNFDYIDKAKVRVFKDIYSDLLSEITKSSKQYFSSDFAKLVFIEQEYKFPIELIQLLSDLRQLFSNKKKEISENFFLELENSFQNIFYYLASKNNFLVIEYPSIQKHRRKTIRTKSSELLSFKAVVYKKIDNHNSNQDIYKRFCEFVCEKSDLTKVKITIKGLESEIYNQIEIGTTLYFSQFKSIKENELINIYDSFIVLEPEIMLDVTEIADSFNNKSSFALINFVKKFLPNQISESLVLGNLYNTIFDEILTDKEIEFEKAYNIALRSKPLNLFAIDKVNPEFKTNLKEKLLNFYKRVKSDFDLKEDKIYTLEPTFISPEYGLQGRLDLLIEDKNYDNKKDVVELKSGKSPKDQIYFKSFDGNNTNISVWHSHFAQTTAYNMLLDINVNNRKGNSSIYYPLASSLYLRNIPNVISAKKQLIFERNKIIELNFKVANKKFDFLNDLKESIANVPIYNRNQVQSYYEFISYKESILPFYLIQMSAFIQRESLANSLGLFTDIKQNEKSNDSIVSIFDNEVDNNEIKNCITFLKLNVENTDFNKMYLCFDRNDNEKNSVLRKSDMVILYPQDDNLNQRHIYKTYIKEINSNQIVLSLRNKLINHSIITKIDNWLLIPDSSDSINKKLYSEIYSFVNSNKIDYFIGNKKPRCNEIDYNLEGLNPVQNRICQKALKSKDYFLIQGPPGTGKTSYVLKTLVEQIYNSSNQNILLVSYTNRAVDEICTAIKRISDEIEIIRLGSKEVSIHKDLLFAELIEELNLKELNLKLKRTRIIASTVASLINTPEIFQIKNFDVAIIDEASQILEPYIVGIISKVSKFIMIGDEKQLPAITQQSPEYLKIKSKKLNDIGFEDFSISYFERLLTNAKKNVWIDCFDMLETQSRMHKDIMNLTNYMFYNNKLSHSDNFWQSENFEFYKTESRLSEILSKSRIIFINCPNEKYYKFNKAESSLTIRIIDEIILNLNSNFNENSIGVISPFRLQCSEISNLLDNSIRNLITIDTVERFQGSEREFIIISTAVNKEIMLQSILSSVVIDEIEIDRKLNVALTRAKKQVLILGNEEVLSKSKIYKKMIEFIKENGQFVNLDEIVI